MAGTRYTDAEIYVDADPAFHTFIRRTLAARWDGLPESERFAVHVGKHKGYSRDVGPEDFLGWRTLVDVTAAQEASDQAMVAFVGDLIDALASVGYRSLAVCPFADEIRPPR